MDAVMTETEYLRATNLAKVRVALALVVDVLPDGIVTPTDRRLVSEMLGQWQRDLEAVVQTEPDPL
jgi:hypothetical protein